MEKLNIKEFDLSEWIITPKGQINQILCPMLPVSSIKEFIKRIKDLIGDSWYMDSLKDEIDKLAGDELNGI